MSEQPWRAVVERGDLAIVMLRHGRTSWNAARRFLGATDIPLDEEGRRQAERVAPAYRGAFHHVYSSPLSRAFQTASAIEPEPVLLEAFGELRQGDLEGLTAAQAIERYPDFFEVWARDPANAPVPGGETLGECAARARHALDRLCRVHAGDQAILVVTHQMVMASLTCYASDEPLKKWREFCVDNTAGRSCRGTGYH